MMAEIRTEDWETEQEIERLKDRGWRLKRLGDPRAALDLLEFYESALEEGRVPYDEIDKIQLRIDSLRDTYQKCIAKWEERTGFKWDERVRWFRDPVTGRFARVEMRERITE